MEKKFSSSDHRGYESYWDQLAHFTNNNLTLPLEQLWDYLNYWDLGPSPERFKTNEEANSIFISVIEEGSEKNISLYDATYLKKNFLTKILLSQVNDSTDLIVEIGGGWGRNIFALYSNLSEKYSNIEFIMGEVTISGQNVCSSIANNYNLPVISTYFNYYDWENLINLIQHKKYKNICVFSNHSIEQIPYLEYEMFDDFLNLEVDSLRFTHIEPVGFQMTGGSSNYTGKSFYNQNLMPILSDLVKQNRIQLTKLNPDCFAIGGWSNCGSLIQWEKI